MWAVLLPYGGPSFITKRIHKSQLCNPNFADCDSLYIYIYIFNENSFFLNSLENSTVINIFPSRKKKD